MCQRWIYEYGYIYKYIYKARAMLANNTYNNNSFYFVLHFLFFSFCIFFLILCLHRFPFSQHTNACAKRDKLNGKS